MFGLVLGIAFVLCLVLAIRPDLAGFLPHTGIGEGAPEGFVRGVAIFGMIAIAVAWFFLAAPT